MSDESKKDLPDIQTPLVDDHLPADRGARANLGILPPGVFTDGTPPRELRQQLAEAPNKTLCGSPFTFVWQNRSSSGYQVPKGLAITMYCAEPLCMETGYCTGPKFAPSYPQYTHADPDAPLRTRRQLSAEEVIAGARWCAKAATGKTDPRSDREIARYAGTILQKIMATVTGGGQWTP